jgi:hypothetical protein
MKTLFFGEKKSQTISVIVFRVCLYLYTVLHGFVLTVHISASGVPVHHGIDGAAEGAEPPSHGHGEQRLRGCRGDH